MAALLARVKKWSNLGPNDSNLTGLQVGIKINSQNSSYPSPCISQGKNKQTKQSTKPHTVCWGNNEVKTAPEQHCKCWSVTNAFLWAFSYGKRIYLLVKTPLSWYQFAKHSILELWQLLDHKYFSMDMAGLLLMDPWWEGELLLHFVCLLKFLHGAALVYLLHSSVH